MVWLNIAENLKHCEGEAKAELPCVLGMCGVCVRGELVGAGTNGGCCSLCAGTNLWRWMESQG